MFCVPKINKNDHQTDSTKAVKDKHLGIKPVSVDKSNVMESLPEKVIEKKFVLEKVNVKKDAKNKRDPAAPKKPRTSFLLWSMDERATLKESEEFANLSFGDVTKELGKRWNALNPETKEMYEGRSQTEKMNISKIWKIINQVKNFRNLQINLQGNLKR